MFHILLSKLGYDINYHKKAQKLIFYPILLSLFSEAQNQPYKPNTHILFYLNPKNTYTWKYLKSP